LVGEVLSFFQSHRSFCYRVTIGPQRLFALWSFFSQGDSGALICEKGGMQYGQWNSEVVQ
jgi:hypothetical protein